MKRPASPCAKGKSPGLSRCAAGSAAKAERERPFQIVISEQDAKLL